MSLTPEEEQMARAAFNPVNPAQPYGEQPGANPLALHPHHTRSLWDALKAGAETSVTGLAVRQQSPEDLLAADPTRAERLTYNVGQISGDLPTLIVGGFVGAAAGAPGGPTALVTGGAGAMALTEGARTWMLEQFKNGVDKQSIADRIAATAWAATKGVVIGGATAGVGGKVAKFAGPLVATPAELATMVTVSKALEGETPSAQDFMDGAIMLGGFKSAHIVAGKLMETYRKTGKKPAEVVQEAVTNPVVHDQLVDPEYDAIPDTLKPYERPSEPVRLASETMPPENDIHKYPYPGSTPDEPTFPELARNVPDSEAAMLAQTRLSEAYAAEYTAAKGGTLTLVARAQGALKQLNDWIGPDVMKEMKIPEYVDGTAENYAVILARRAAVFESYRKLAATSEPALKEGATDAEYAHMIAMMHGIRLQEKWLSGSSAASSRAFAAWQKQALDATMSAADRAQIFKDIVMRFGGTEAAKMAAEMLDKIKNDPKALASMGRKSSRFSKLVAAWKLGLISGPRTAEVVWLSHAAYLVTRMARDTMSGLLGTVFQTKEGLRLSDTLGMYMGMTKGALDGIKAIGGMYKADALKVFAKAEAAKEMDIDPTAADLFGTKTPEEKPAAGPSGEATGVPSASAAEAAMSKDQMTTPEFKSRLGILAEMLTSKTHQAAYMLFRTMNERAELYMQAQRLVHADGNWKFGDQGYWVAVDQLVQNPTKYMLDRAKVSAARGAFQERGPIIDAINQFKMKVPGFNFIMPFVTVPGSLFKEAARLSPAAPLVKQWWDDARAGGERQQRAMVEWGMGTAFALALWYLKDNGNITGGGGPTAEQKSAERAAGVLPYSVYKDGQYIQYQRMHPFGILMGMVADLHDGYHLLDTAQKQRATTAMVFGFMHAITNETWMKGLTDLVGAMHDPARAGEHYLESLAGSVVPAALAQTAGVLDPYTREVDGVLDAVKNRIPGYRETLLPRYDVFGQPMANIAEGNIGPAMTSTASPDKVRQEAARLGYGAGPVVPGAAPSALPMRFPGRPADARLELSPEQHADIARIGGTSAYSTLAPIVNSPAWDSMPDLNKRMYYQRAFSLGRKRALLETVPVEQRAGLIDQLKTEYLQ